MEAHNTLLGMGNRRLRLLSGEATHQHYKGGLYRLLGPVRNADDGNFLSYTMAGLGSEDGGTARQAVLYQHVYPFKREYWVREMTEFNDWIPAGKAAEYWHSKLSLHRASEVESMWGFQNGKALRFRSIL